MKAVIISFCSLIFAFGVGLPLVEYYLTVKYGKKVGAYRLITRPDTDSRYLSLLVPNYCDPVLRVCSNNESFRRGSPTPLMKSPGVERIMAYGDSINLGLGVNDGDDYPTQLEDLLNRTRKGRYEVLNTGRGNSPTIHLFHLRKDIPRLNPDAIILQIELVNDLSDETFSQTEGVDSDGMPKKLIRARYVLGWGGEPLSIFPIRGSFLEATKTYSFLSHSIGNFLSDRLSNELFERNAREAYFNQGFDRFYLTRERLEKSFDRMFDSIRLIKDYLSLRGIRFHLLILPSSYAVNPSDPHFQWGRSLILRAEERAASLGISFTSPYEIETNLGGERFFQKNDFCHLNKDGYRLVAQELNKVW